MRGYTKPTAARAAARPDQADFVSRMMAIPVATFNRMVIKANLPPKDSAALCASFKRLQAETTGS